MDEVWSAGSGAFEQDVLSEQKFDLYLFLFDNRYRGQEVCIRYGDNPEQYISPGPLADFIQSACYGNQNNSSSEYWVAWTILKETGRINWAPKEQTQ